MRENVNRWTEEVARRAALIGGLRPDKEPGQLTDGFPLSISY